jgi:peptidoglycan/xylan/chitin deacetylase (PgdA/CDA1 family)
MVLFLAVLWSGTCVAEVVTRLPGAGQAVALTFDACETRTPSYFDREILDYLMAEGIPFTVFVSGRFARRNAEQLKALAANPAVEIENHSLNHIQHMERLGDEEVVREVVEAERLLGTITGRNPQFFRFPAGNYDQRTLDLVEGLGFRVVHWSFASGDPDKYLTPNRLAAWVLAMVRPGDILIFHVNGRGYSTGKALPGIIQQLRQRGYRFVRIDELLGGSKGHMRPATEGLKARPVVH